MRASIPQALFSQLRFHKTSRVARVCENLLAVVHIPADAVFIQLTMASTRFITLCYLLLALASMACAHSLLTREDLAPILAHKVVIPNNHESSPPSPPKPTPWPFEFTIAFTTDGGTAKGLLLYDWANKQQAIIHAASSSHCLLARNTTSRCYILENPRGTFEVNPVARTCELTNPGVGTVPPTWVMQGVFVGVEEVKGVKCNRFDFPPTLHSWLESVDGGLPCAFLFPRESYTYYFDAKSLKIGQPALNAFRVPEYCPQTASSQEGGVRADH